jgi:DNA modification methylase
VTITLHHGDAATVLAGMPAQSVHCVVTSIPYFNQRDYLHQDHPDKHHEIGNEEDIPAYIDAIANVFDALWPVLRDDGTLWLNIGDKYANDRKWGGQSSGKHANSGYAQSGGVRRKVKTNEPAKSLIGLPWMIAFALKARGWILRQEIIWHKTNAMPNSHTDRLTTAHEPIFLFTKRPNYFLDPIAIAEPAKQYNGETTLIRNPRDIWSMAIGRNTTQHFATFPIEIPLRAIKAGTSAHGCCPICGAPWRRITSKRFHTQPDVVRAKVSKASQKGMDINNGWGAAPRGANAIETIDWKPGCTCSQDHHDLKPNDLETICTPTGAGNATDPTKHTGRAGMNRKRNPNEGTRAITRYEQRHYAAQLKTSPHRQAMQDMAGLAFAHYLRTDRAGARPIPPDLLTTWLANNWLTYIAPPTVTPYTPVPGVVLDPFAGSGTTLLAAQQLDRDAIGIDLNAEYVELMRTRLQTT